MCESTILKILSVQNAPLLLQTAHFRDAFALKKRCLSFILDRFGEVIATEVRCGCEDVVLHHHFQD